MATTTLGRRFLDTAAFVTGGASGIGAATARRLAAEGACVVIGDLDLDGAEMVAKEVDGVAVRLDVADGRSIERAVAAAEAEVGPISVLINNAGTDRMAFFTDTDQPTWDHVLAVNLRGTLACTHALLRGMYDRRRGAIVNVASEAGVVGAMAGATYAASKGGVIAFTKAIAREGARYGVRCNAVAPGPIETPLLNGAVAAAGPRGVALKQGMIDATVLGRTGLPEEVAAGIAFLASADASYITGHTLAISGGVSMT